MVLWTAHQPTRVLDGADPVLPLSSRYVFYIAGGFGLAVSAFLLVINPRHAMAKLLLTVWLATNYLAYAIGLRLTNSANLFSCLGNVNNGLPIPPKILDFTLDIYFGGLLLGALLLLIFDWLAQRKPTPLDSMPLAAQKSG